jgi:multiple sugar transport system permease protein
MMRRRTLADREDWLGGLLLAPALLYVAVLVGVPFTLAILLSFSDATAGNLRFDWVGLSNYLAILADPIFLRALRNTILVTLGTQLLVVVLSTAAAQVFRAAFRGRRFARFVLVLPWAVPVSLGAIAWTWIFDSTFSVINWTLRAAGLMHGWLYWLGDPALALVSIIIVQAWRIFPSPPSSSSPGPPRCRRRCWRRRGWTGPASGAVGSRSSCRCSCR